MVSILPEVESSTPAVLHTRVLVLRDQMRLTFLRLEMFIATGESKVSVGPFVWCHTAHGWNQEEQAEDNCERLHFALESQRSTKVERGTEVKKFRKGKNFEKSVNQSGSN